MTEVATTGDWIIEARALGRNFGDQNALDGVDLQVQRGEIFGVVGPDGAGKTTLIQLCAAILDPTAGDCRVLGFDTVTQAEHVTSRIGYMSQGFTLYDKLTVDENLAFAAHIRNIRDDAFRQRRIKLLEMAGLSTFVRRWAGDLSGGMRKKLSLCTNLIHEPPLLLLDELSLGVDPRSRRELWRMLHIFRDQGATVVVTTPYMDEALHCDRLAFLHRGKLLAVDTPRALCEVSRGEVFELLTTSNDQVRRQLTGRSEVVGMQTLSDRVGFQLVPGASLPADLYRELAALGRLQQAEPGLESTFIHMVAETQSTVPESRQAPAPLYIAESAVAADHVTVRFGTFTAVDNLTIHINPGEVIGWLGPNGAGKTTLIRVLCGLLLPVAGQVSVAGVDVSRQPLALKGRIGYMSQRFSLYPDLSVDENLGFFAGVYGLNGGQRREAISWVSEMTDLVGIGMRRVGDISGAFRQRLSLACAIMHRPTVLFLDEPTSGVDPVARQRFWQLIQSLAAAGMAVLVTTHYLEEARFCHRLGLMAEGRLIALGSMDQLRTGVAQQSDADIETVFMAYLQRVATEKEQV